MAELSDFSIPIQGKTMGTAIRGMLILMILVVAGTTVSTAQAYDGCYGAQNSRAYGNGWWPYTLGYVPVPPYYALHPPVYYSVPVARPYGYSPYPLPGTVMPPIPESPVALEITNPYVERNEVDSVATTPQLIVNPYVLANPTPSANLARQPIEPGR